MFGGQAIGVAMGGGISGALIAHQGLPAAALALAAIVGAILGLVLIVRERPGERLTPWTRGAATQRNLDLHLGAFWPIVRNLLTVMFTRRTLLLIPAFMAATAGGGIFMGLAPLFAAKELGWTKDAYSAWSSQAYLASGILGALLLGGVAGRWGARRMLILCMLLMAAVAFLMLALRAHWASPAILIGAIFTFSAISVFRGVTGGALAMRICAPSVAATQFAVFMAIFNLGKAGASASLGWLDSLGGIPAMFTAIGVSGLVAAAFAFAAKVGR